MNSREAILLVRKWGNFKVDGRPLKEFLTYGDMPYWDIIEANFATRLYETKESSKLKNHLLKYASLFGESKRNLTKKMRFRGKILVIPTIESETPIIAPVIKRLDCITLRIGSIRERMKRSLEEAGIESIPIEAFITEESKERSKEAIRFLKERWKILKNDDEFKASINWDEVKEDFEYYFSTRERIFEIVKYIETMRVILDGKPDLILALDELSETGKPMSILAKQRKIPLLVVQHGLFGEGSSIFGPSLADKVCLWGPQSKKLLLKRRFREKQLVITGCPKFDALKGHKEHGIVLFASEPVKGIETIAEAVVKATLHKKLVVKLHPREYNERLYRRLANRFSANITITRDNLYELISECEFVITPYSTVGLEALIMGKNVITVSPEKINPIYGKTDAMIHARPEGLVTAIKSLEDPETARKLERKRKRFVHDHAYKIDGKATERVVCLVDRLKEAVR